MREGAWELVLRPQPAVEPLIGLPAGFRGEVVPAVGGPEDQFSAGSQKAVDLPGALHDLPDPADVLSLATTLVNVSPDLRTSVSQLKQDLATSNAPPLVE